MNQGDHYTAVLVCDGERPDLFHLRIGVLNERGSLLFPCALIYLLHHGKLAMEEQMSECFYNAKYLLIRPSQRCRDSCAKDGPAVVMLDWSSQCIHSVGPGLSGARCCANAEQRESPCPKMLTAYVEGKKQWKNRGKKQLQIAVEEVREGEER